MEIQSNILDPIFSLSQDLNYFRPELVLLICLFVCFFADLLIKKNKGLWLSSLAISGVLAYLWFSYTQFIGLEEEVYFMSDLMRLERSIVFVKLIFGVTTLGAIILAIKTKWIQIPLSHTGEYYFMLIALLLGSVLLPMANNWLVFFLLMEFLSITGYIITTFNRDKSSYEGAIKYLLFGAAASAIMLYGISLIYGMTGSMSIGDLANGMELDSGLLSLGLLFVLLGIFFKIALFPMHVWLPSAYQGAPSSGIVLLSVAPKVAALLFLWYLTSIIELGKIGFDLLPMFQWQQMIGILAIITMLGANAAALWQTNVKRLLAWSSVGHGGFMLAGVLTLSAFGQSTLLFYASVYALMNMGAFLLVLLIKKRTQNEEDINAFRGLASLHPFLGVLVTLLMLSFIGLPPTGGFMAKFLLFSAIWDTYQQSGEPIYIWVFAAGLFSSVISLFYYMKIPYLMYFKPLNSKDPKLVSLKSLDYLMMFLIVVALMVLFFKANWLMNILNSLNFAL